MTNRPAVPNKFRYDLERTVATLADNPMLGHEPPRSRNARVRRYLMPSTPYEVYYEYLEADDQVLVLRVFGTVSDAHL